MEREINKVVALNQDLSTNIKKSTIFIKICYIYCRFSLPSEYYQGIFLLNNKIGMRITFTICKYSQISGKSPDKISFMFVKIVGKVS